jgi:hypothetical protein
MEIISYLNKKTSVFVNKKLYIFSVTKKRVDNRVYMWYYNIEEVFVKWGVLWSDFER